MNQQNIKTRLYRIIMIVCIFLSISSIIGNFIVGFPILINLKWLFLLTIAIFSFFLSNNKRYINQTMLILFLFLIYIFLPFSFIDSGGSNNNIMGYTFLLLISVIYLFGGWKRPFLVFSVIGVFVIMHAVEFYYPEIIPVYSDWKQFTDRIIQTPLLFLSAFLIIMSFAKEYERVNNKLESYANYDELTGLYNRRMFNVVMEDAIENAENKAHLAMLDLDNFKKVNDKFGHYVGDEVLKELAVILGKRFSQDKHLVSRWGGDEFAIIYYGEKEKLAQKLEEVKKEFIDYAASYEETIGISISIVSLSDYDKADHTIIAADKKLYKEKLKKQ